LKNHFTYSNLSKNKTIFKYKKGNKTKTKINIEINIIVKFKFKLATSLFYYSSYISIKISAPIRAI
uniref:hypothetical protein n=1 Tax=Clostridium perfringens TaxID=1502 RepID=UPI0039E7BAE9